MMAFWLAYVLKFTYIYLVRGRRGMHEYQMHLTNTYHKLDVASRISAVKKAAALGIVSFGEFESVDGR